MNTKKSNTKCEQMLKLYAKDISISDIAKELKVRYNFVYNVVSRNLKKQGLEMNTHNPKTVSKKSQIVSLYFDSQLSMNKIAKKLNTNTSYVWQVVNDERLSK